MSSLPTNALDPALAGFVDQDHHCVRCGYSLQGLPRAGKCPECGAPVEMSIRGFYLAYAAPEYLETVRSGLTLVLRGIMLTFAVYVIVFILLIAAAGAGAGSSALKLVIESLALVPAIMLVIGYWRFTQPDLGFLSHEVPTAARKVIRVTVCIQAGATAVSTLAEVASAAGSTLFSASPALDTAVQIIVGLAGLTSFIAWSIQFFAVMRYTRWLAWRVPDGVLMKKTRTYSWVVPVVFVLGSPLILIGPLVAIILYWNLLNRLRKQFRAIQLTGLPSRFV